MPLNLTAYCRPTIRHTAFDYFDVGPSSSVHMAIALRVRVCFVLNVLYYSHLLYVYGLTVSLYYSSTTLVRLVVSHVFLFTILLYPSCLYCYAIVLSQSYVSTSLFMMTCIYVAVRSVLFRQCCFRLAYK